jgi:hypothetical protein
MRDVGSLYGLGKVQASGRLLRKHLIDMAFTSERLAAELRAKAFYTYDQLSD